MKFQTFLALHIILVMSTTMPSYSQENYSPTEENLEMREWFQDAKFGLFIHWGVYSEMAGGGERNMAEWIMQEKQIPVKAYEKLPSFFNPIAFDPKEWVDMAKKAGIKYITITSKHHDGFAMFDSKVSDYDIVDRTPYGKDVLKMLKDECDKQGIKLFFYYSQLDWHHPDYWPRGHTGVGYTGRPQSGNWGNYIKYMNTQLTELLTNYGSIGGIWFDGMWDKWDENWHLDETYALIHQLQPAALIGSNHHKAPFPGEDFQMFERDLPGHNTMGFNQTGEISPLPLEMCETMNGSWGFNLKDDQFKSSKTLIQTIVKAAGYNANLLLNTGPMPNGKIQPENVDTLMKVGKWLDQFGETIYGTRGGHIAPHNWGISTKKDNIVFVHVLDLQDKNLLLPQLPGKIKSMKYFSGKRPLKYKQSEYGVLVEVPFEERDDLDTIIEIELE